MTRPSSRSALYSRLRREWLPSRRSSVTEDSQPSRIEIPARSRSFQCFSIRSQSIAFSPNNESMCLYVVVAVGR
jgi:hypothetical protein